MTDIVKTLNWAQMKIGAEAGVMRSLSAIFNNRSGRYGASDDVGWEGHITSSQAEFAVALHYNLSWDGALGDFSAKDAGRILQVRSTLWPSGKLLLHKPDRDDDPFVLVVVTKNIFTMRGWCFGRDGKLPELWGELPNRPGRPAFKVDVARLEPMETLEEVVDRRWRLGMTVPEMCDL